MNRCSSCNSPSRLAREAVAMCQRGSHCYYPLFFLCEFALLLPFWNKIFGSVPADISTGSVELGGSRSTQLLERLKKHRSWVDLSKIQYGPFCSSLWAGIVKREWGHGIGIPWRPINGLFFPLITGPGIRIRNKRGIPPPAAINLCKGYWVICFTFKYEVEVLLHYFILTAMQKLHSRWLIQDRVSWPVRKR